MNRNQHYEFWVSYYDELMDKGTLSDKGVDASNRSLTGHCWTQGGVPIPMQEQTLYFKVLYPGLLIGLGNAHFSQSAESEIKLGFTFDPVTGLPFLPGSSVKGILRSAFLANREYVQECLKDCISDLKLSDSQIQELELDIFGSYHPHGSYTEKRRGVGIGKDIFFDAYPVKADKNRHLLGIENITPHLAKDPELEGLTDPNPLSLFKVMPGVVMQFRFKLSDSVLKDGDHEITVPADKKLKLLQTILEDFGVGAKTNVGFGSLKACVLDNIPESGFCYLVQEAEVPTSPERNYPAQRPAQKSPKHPAQNQASVQPGQQRGVFDATVTGIKPFGVFVRLDNNAGTGMVPVQEIANGYISNIGQFISLGDRVKVIEIPSSKAGKRAFSIKRAKQYKTE